MRWIASYARDAVVAGLLLWLSPGLAFAQRPAAVLYEQAKQAEKRLHRSESRLQKKSEWVSVARKYRNVVLQHPRSGYCDDALYYEAEIYHETARRFSDREALVRTLDAYLLLANGYPSSQWAKRARLNRGKIFLQEVSDRPQASIELRKVTSEWPNSVEAAEARRLLENMKRSQRRPATEKFPPGIVGVRNIRHWTGREYTRIVIDLDGEVKYRQAQLENPDRIYFDLLGTQLTTDLASRTIPIEDGFLQRIRVRQNRPSVVRVVLDFQNISEYNVFSLPDPYRLVVDILGTEPEPERTVAERKADPGDGASQETASERVPATRSAAEPPAGGEGGAPPEASDNGAAAEVAASELDLRVTPEPTRDGYSLARQLGLAARRVVIDPGHGGHDPGTMSPKHGLQEKEIVLDISRRVAKMLERERFEVHMTRERDVFVPLEERTAIANAKEADLFVSIHVNASRSSRPRGTETYYLNLATTPDAEEVAARENAVTTRRLGELRNLLQKVMNNSKITESRELADHVQGAMASGLFGSKRHPQNRGVKTAPFYVLLGAQMPSVLIEVAYLSNHRDAELLSDVAYRQKIARSIVDGIRGYHDTLVRTTRVSVDTARADPQ